MTGNCILVVCALEDLKAGALKSWSIQEEIQEYSTEKAVTTKQHRVVKKPDKTLSVAKYSV